MPKNRALIAHCALKLPALFSLLAMVPVHAQTRGSSDAEAAAACAACGGGLTFVIFLIVAIFVLNIALLVWVVRDAKSRGMDSAALWMILVMFTGPIGLIIYFFSRPQGNLISCPACKNKRLQVSARCPHCGNS